MRRTLSSGLVAAALISACAAFTLEAAVPVAESTGTTVRGPAATSTPRASGTGSSASSTGSSARTYPESSANVSARPAAGGTGELFYQLQLLQNEVSELRGMLEQQSHQISRLEQNQQEQYLDVDRRLSALAGVGGSASSSTQPSDTGHANPTTQRGSVASGDEQADYAAAYEFIKTKDFERAITAFSAFLKDYPDGSYGGNAYYWLGESYLALPDADLERARQSFAQVVQRYPSHTKVPDALFKLGVVYHLLGDEPKAMEYLNKVQKDYEGSLAARLALSYSAEL